MADDDTAIAGYSRADDIPITPFTIRSRRFRKRLLLGLDPAEVIAFRDLVADALENAGTRYINVAAQMKVLERDLQARTTTQAANPRLDVSHETAAQAQGAHTAGPLATLRSAAMREVEVLLHEAQERADAFIEAASPVAMAGRSFVEYSWTHW